MLYALALASILFSLHLVAVATSFAEALQQMERSWLQLHGPARVAVPAICSELKRRERAAASCQVVLKLRHFGDFRDACPLVAAGRVIFTPRYYRLESACTLLPAPIRGPPLKLLQLRWQTLL